MPNRILKESICTSDTINRLSWFEEVFYYRLIVNCDDYGIMDARPAILKAKLFPLKDRITNKDISAALTKLADMGCVRLYACDSKPYLCLPAWSVHQTIRAHKSKYPKFEDRDSEDEINCKQMHADACKCSRNPIQSESNSESKKKKTAREARRSFVPPTVEEVESYCRERKNGISGQSFVDFYTSKNWKIGKDKMADWEAAVRNWENRMKENEKPQKDTSYDLDEYEAMIERQAVEDARKQEPEA